MTAPVEWTVVQVVRVIDGDSIRVRRSRRITLDGHAWRLVDDDPDGYPLRLLWVDTPERGDVGWAQARADLSEWVSTHGPLVVQCYYPDAFGRMLADLQDADGNSASQWLMAERGWSPWVAS